mgnify:CR=1 FL=1
MPRSIEVGWTLPVLPVESARAEERKLRLPLSCDRSEFCFGVFPASAPQLALMSPRALVVLH